MPTTRTLRSPRATLAGALVLPALIIALTGCAGGSESSEMMPPESISSAQSDKSGSEESTSADEDVVTTIGLKFMPDDLIVKVGTTVTWQNGESIGHTVPSGAWGEVNESTGLRGTETPDGRFDHKLAPKGQEGDTFSYTFDEPGEYMYYCQPHLTMNATVTVEP